MVKGSTWTLANPIAVRRLTAQSRARASASVAGQALAHFGGQSFDDIPGIMVVLERVVAQRGDLGIDEHRRWERGGGLLGEGGGGRCKQKRSEEIGFHALLAKAGKGRKSPAPVD